MEKKKLSLTYRIIRFCGINIPEAEYGQISLLRATGRYFAEVWHSILQKYCMYSVLLAPLNYRIIRPMIWRWLGAKVGKDCYIGYSVYMDLNNAKLITVEDHVHIDEMCFLLCHKRDFTGYFQGDEYSKLGYKEGPIHIKRNSSIGSCSIIMPGVTIGEGAVIGAGSLVTKDIPDWSIAVGRPAKVVKTFPKREENENQEG